MKTTRYTIYLLHDVNTASDALSPEKVPEASALDPDVGIEGVFFYETRPASPPGWVASVSPLLQPPTPVLTTSSASGLLVVKIDEHFFALTFGYGKGLLNPSKIVHRFGLKVALNRIDPRQLRSMDTKVFEDMVVSRSTNVSKKSELPSFGVDVSRDILRAVTGEPRDQAMFKRLYGSDAVVVSATSNLDDLGKICTELFSAYNEDTYKENFSWVDHLAEVRESGTRDELDALLCGQLMAGDISNTHLAMPEALAWEDVELFRITGTGDLDYDDLDIDRYLDALGSKLSEISVSRLKSRRVSVKFGRTEDMESRWTLYQCLVTEQRLRGILHVLIEGRWFAVDESLVSRVDDFVGKLEPARIALLPARPREVEAAYNRRLAESMPSQFLLLDAKIDRPQDATSGIEFCDVLTSEGELVHVKRKSQSSTLSHLLLKGESLPLLLWKTESIETEFAGPLRVVSVPARRQLGFS